MNTTKQQIDRILAHESVTTKRFATLAIGESIRQGDIYITRIPVPAEFGAPWGSRQVAVGNSVGSRHVAVGPVEVFTGDQKLVAQIRPLWTPTEVRACTGPIVVASGTWVLEHPEHPHHELAHADTDVACYQVTYQWNHKTAAAVRD